MCILNRGSGGHKTKDTHPAGTRGSTRLLGVIVRSMPLLLPYAQRGFWGLAKKHSKRLGKRYYRPVPGVALDVINRDPEKAHYARTGG